MTRLNAPADPSLGERIRARRQLRRWSLRHAADRAGINASTWMRIERGELRTDRYMLCDLASALECSVSELTGRPHVPGDRALETAHARTEAAWRALVEIAPDEPPARPAPPIAELEARVAHLTERRLASDYATTVDLLPALLVDLHAASTGREAATALRLTIDATHTAMLTLRHLGYAAEPTLAAERCRQAAEQLDEPVPLAVADWTRAHAAFASGSFARAYNLAGRNIDGLAPHLSLGTAHEVIGMLHLTAAVAVLGERRVDDARSHLAEAQRLAGITGETTSWTMLFGPANVGVWAMQVEIDSGEPGRAVEIAETVDSGVLSTARRASFHVEFARALTDIRQDEVAVKHLLVAERTAPQLTRSSVAARETARFLLHKARREAGGSALRGLCERFGVAV